MSFSVWILLLCFLGHEGKRHTVRAMGGVRNERDCSAVPPYLPPTAVNTTQRLHDLRAAMKPHNISAYIIPQTDAHQSEYIAPRDARLAWLSGFSGSSGTAVVTQDKAVLWTDSRYWVQAERQMDCNWELERHASVASITNWLIKEVKENGSVGIDLFLFSVNTFAAYNNNLAPAQRILKSIPDNLVDKIWTERPPLRPVHLTRLPDNFIERTWQMKVDQVRELMKNNPYKPTAVLLSALDETAWLFNMRGDDIPFNPFFYSYTLLTLDGIWLFVHTERVTEEMKVYLNTSCTTSHCVQLQKYEAVKEQLNSYLLESDVRVWVGTEYTTQAVFELIAPEKLLESDYSPVLSAKAVKDENEQRLLREAHIRDAVAVMQLLMKLEKTVSGAQETELTAAEFVDECRSKQKHTRGPSFETISASGPNAALAHYSPSHETARKLSENEMYLIDSGGQYLDGTTDITRTVHWGTPTDLEKECFTRVLMGNIEISRTIFPANTKGVYLEMLGRRALWEVGLNYGHGTGHGVGNYFGVHEWPVGFQTNNIPFKEGMFTSIEPGYYRENEFGIRIEDVAVTVSAKTKHGQDYLTFETVSLVPYDRKLIDTSIMSPEQLQWLDSYYQTIRTIMGPELERQNLNELHVWMMDNTKPFLKANASAVIPSISLLLLLFITLL